MSAPRMAASGASPVYPPVNAQWTARRDKRPAPQPKIVPFTRRYDVRWIDDAGQIEDFTRVAPAIDHFEAAFSALTHGAVVATTDGPVAVEDLEPGMMIETTDGQAVKLRWIGSMTIVPNGPAREGVKDKLYRVIADGFGLARPASDVTLGPGARLLDRSAEVRRDLGSEAALAPVEAFADGQAVIEITPMAPTRVYHLSFDAHHIISVNGIEIESFHPGPKTARELDDAMRAQFMALFPHKEMLQDFGRMLWPRYEAPEDRGF